MSKKFKDIKPPTLEEQIEFNLPEVMNSKAFEKSFVKIRSEGKRAKKLKRALTRKKPKINYAKESGRDRLGRKRGQIAPVFYW